MMAASFAGCLFGREIGYAVFHPNSVLFGSVPVWLALLGLDSWGHHNSE